MSELFEHLVARGQGKAQTLRPQPPAPFAASLTGRPDDADDPEREAEAGQRRSDTSTADAGAPKPARHRDAAMPAVPRITPNLATPAAEARPSEPTEPGVPPAAVPPETAPATPPPAVLPAASTAPAEVPPASETVPKVASPTLEMPAVEVPLEGPTVEGTPTSRPLPQPVPPAPETVPAEVPPASETAPAVEVPPASQVLPSQVPPTSETGVREVPPASETAPAVPSLTSLPGRIADDDAGSTPRPAEPPAPRIEVRIGRVHVRAITRAPAPKPARSPRAAVAVSLNDYLAHRRGG